jgi:glycosyltransferase involved in cell wall biosynthesis
MRILHVGWGFFPWRPGGLIFYAEDLMDAQVARGDEVAYFFSGRHYPRISGPRLKRWHRAGVAMHEVVNPPIVPGEAHGTRRPELEVSEPAMEAGFARTLRRVRPDVVHFQELHGLPSSYIDVAGAAGVPTVMTLQDYFPLCSTLRLLDADGRICERLAVGADCVAANAQAPDEPEAQVARTLDYERARLRRRLRVPAEFDFTPFLPLVRAFNVRVARAVRRPPAPGGDPPDAPRGYLADAFQRRRDVNVERLGRVGRLIAQSPRVADVYRARGVSGERMLTLPFTLEHISQLRPRSLASPPQPVTFGTLNGLMDRAKGAELVVEALRRLRAAGHGERDFRLRVLGRVHAGLRAELEREPAVELAGEYEREQLDALLDDVDVGIMPSIWEEAFGYAGVEMVAKGIPLIANPLGGIVEYARDGQTAWLNRSCSAEGLAVLMATLISQPEQIVEMHRRLLSVRDEVVVPMERHAEAIDAIYRELAAG